MEQLNDTVQAQIDRIHVYEAASLLLCLTMSFALVSLGIWLWRSSGLRKQELDVSRERLRYERGRQKPASSASDETRPTGPQQGHEAGPDSAAQPPSARERYFGDASPYQPK